MPSIQQTAAIEASKQRLARNLFIGAAFASFVFSVTLWFTGAKDQGLFVGLWVPSILSLGNLMLNPRSRA